MAQGYGVTFGMVLLGLGLALAIIVPAVVLSRRHSSCSPQAFAHAAVAADSKVCSDIGRAILQQQGSPVDAAIAALVCTGVVNPQSMGLGGGVIFTIYNATTGKVEVINARETVPASHVQGLLDQCEHVQLLGKGTQWIGVPGELRGYAEAHRRHGRLPWAQLFQPTIELLRGDYRTPPILSLFLNNSLLRLSLLASSLKTPDPDSFRVGPRRPQESPCRLPSRPPGRSSSMGWNPCGLRTHCTGLRWLTPWRLWPEKARRSSTRGGWARRWWRTLPRKLPHCTRSLLCLTPGSQLTMQDLASFQPEVVDALAMPLGSYTLYSPPPPAGGALLSFILNVLKGFNFSAESVASPERSVDLYHRFVETVKFARGLGWQLWDPRSHPAVQNTSQELLQEALAQRIRQQIDARGDHQLSHYGLDGAWSHTMGTSHVSVLGEDGSAVSATSTINTPFGAMVYSPRTGILLNNELLDLCWRRQPGSRAAPPPVPGERPPSAMVPSILVNTEQGSKLVIGGAGGELIVSAVAQAIMNKLWLGLDLGAAIVAPILHVNNKGQVEYEPRFSQEVQQGLQRRGHSQNSRRFFLNAVQAVSQDGDCVYAAADPRKHGEAAGY